MSALRGRTALVTGGSRGIGRAVSERLARQGAAVAVLSTTEEGSLAVADALRAQGARTLALAADVADARALDGAVAEVERALGPVDVLVNDAGIALRRPLGEMTDAEWDRVLAVNLSGPFYLARRCVPAMAERRWGRVVNVSSISGRLGSAGMTAYCASKWGLNGFTQALAAEVKDRGVLVTAVLPGSVDTEMLRGSGWTPDMSAAEVAFPRTTAEVSQALRIAHAHRVPVTPCGARSGKSGGSMPVLGGIVLSLERMNTIKSVSVEDLIAVVEPGVITGDLMKAAEAQGLFYPPDPNSWEWCTMGGNIAENAGGPRALKYGVTREYVLGLEWVMPDGEVLRLGKRTIKGVAGYDLVGLLVGSEGTLGVATEITVQLIPLPREVKTALLVFRDVQTAARAVSAILAAGVLPRTLELMDELAVKAVDGKGFNFPPGTGACVLAEVDGNAPDAVLAELAHLGEVAEAHGATETWLADDPAQREKLWAARRTVSTALRALARFKLSEDLVVPRSRISEMIDRCKAVGTALGLRVATYGHAGDGNLHANVLFDLPEERAKVDQALHEMASVAIALGGTITGEHGVGLAKRDLFALEQAAPVLALQRRLKAVFDPDGLFNPGKVFPPGLDS